MAGNSVVISVLADAKQFTKGLGDATKSATSFGDGFKAVGIAAGAALAAAAAGAVAVIGSAIKAAGEAEKVAAQTAAVVASTGAAAQRSVAQISGLAGELSKLSGVDDELIQSGANVLLTFTRISGTNFDAATKSALDMSVALGKDMASSATLVGKALNDPIAGIGALSKVGVQLTADQKALIESMVATGDVAGAQGVILAELNTQFGGSAEAFGNTFEGALGKAKTSLGNLQEALGSAFLPVATAVLAGVAIHLDRLGESPAFQAFLDNISGLIGGLASGDSAIGKFIGQAVELAASISPLGIIFKALAPTLPVLADLIRQLAASLGGALVSILPTITDLASTLVGVLGGVLAAVLPVIVTLVGTLASVFTALMPALVPIIDVLASTLSVALVALAPIITSLATTLGGVLGQVLAALTPLLVLVATVLGEVLGALAPVIPPVVQLVGAVLGLIGPLLALAGTALAPLIELFIAILEPILALVAPLLDLLVPAIGFVADVLSVVIGWIAEAITWFTKLVSGSETASAQFTGAFDGVGKFFGDLIGGIVSFFSTGIGNIVGFFTGLPGQILGALGSLASSLSNIGAQMIQGLINGASSLLGKLSSFVSNLVNRYIVGPVRAFLGIQSPSRVFREIGDDTMQGLTIGLSDTRGVRDAVHSLSKELASTTLPAPRVSSLSVRPSQLAAEQSAATAAVSQMSASDRSFLTELFREFAGSLTVTDGVIAHAANAANQRLVRAGSM